ncbi:ice-binding family protein [Tardiphaga sp. vice278]|uniref:ice-binding family protein n=1 Tax=Tardiphaga sp. vice278 TaxID=2592815 RepID=UPI001162C2E8|nr:ice-binding family protein [Tardiphaga sp. vice278]QDM16838.1 DUF3494 domain-containing protein [Tardiphaga sp. vice278]
MEPAKQKRSRIPNLVAAALLVSALPTAASAQVPDLGTAANFAVLAGSTVTNTGTTIITGNVGVSPGSAITGFPPGVVLPPGSTFVGDAVAAQAQIDLTAGYNTIAARSTTADLTGTNLGGMTLTPGVYSFTTAAFLTGTLTLNALGNPNAVFIFNIGSTLTTASASTVRIIGGGTGNNVYWRVGTSATLGTTTTLVGDILALTSITLNTGATISCGSTLARNGAVTLDTNTIATRNLTAACTPSALLPSTVPANTAATTAAINSAFATAIANNNGILPNAFAQAFLNLSGLSPAQLLLALQQLNGEVGTGVAQSGFQAMNSFLSLVLSPNPGDTLSGDRSGIGPSRPGLIVKAPYPVKVTAAMAAFNAARRADFDPDRWGIWGAAYGGQTRIGGDTPAGLHDLNVRSYGFAGGLDYRLFANTTVGFALGGGATSFGLSDNMGGGRSDMLQAAIYSSTRFNAAYVSMALAYAWHDVTTDQYLSVANSDRLTANFKANNVGGRIEGGYRFGIPAVYMVPAFGITPYAALQGQAYFTPAYSENASSIFARSYDARTSTVYRTELGAWFDTSQAFYNDSILTLRSRAAWAHDEYSDPSISASFIALPGYRFVTYGVAPARDLLLASVGAEVRFRNRISVGAQFDGEFADRTTKYSGRAVVRYSW